MNNSVLLTVENVEASYGAVQAIRGVSLTINQGCIVALLGANGAGKTTLLKTLSAVLEPAKGRVEFNGAVLNGLEPDEVVRKGVVHVPEGREMFPLLSVKDNLLLGAYSRQDRSTVADTLDEVLQLFPDLRNLLHQHAGYLSGGQQQMLAIGRGLMSQPKLMLLDEPSLGLSPMLVKHMMTIVTRLNQDYGVTVLLVEQNAQAALQIADSGFVMENGRVVMAGSKERLLASRDIQESYLGQGRVPQKGEGSLARRWKRRKTWR